MARFNRTYTPKQAFKILGRAAYIQTRKSPKKRQAAIKAEQAKTASRIAESKRRLDAATKQGLNPAFAGRAIIMSGGADKIDELKTFAAGGGFEGEARRERAASLRQDALDRRLQAQRARNTRVRAVDAYQRARTGASTQLQPKVKKRAARMLK